MKSVIVTGAGSGIGKATAERFLKEGWAVIALGRRIEPLKKLQTTERCLAYSCDLTDPEQVTKFAADLSTMPAHSPFAPQNLRALINNAGIFTRQSFLETDEQKWQEQFAANFFAPVRLTKAVLPFISQGGSIVNVSSTLGLKPVAGTAAYSAAKAALINWTQTLALEMAPLLIRVNCVCPGIVDTPIHAFHEAKDKQEILDSLKNLQPLGRVGKPEEVAHSIYHFCAPGSEWMTGSILAVDGGINLL